uniref:Carbohydrate sulfotransferase n=1 Tax=Oryzias latipes TaxID=8090 RepID=A0A3P9HK75_ORYLA
MNYFCKVLIKKCFFKTCFCIIWMMKGYNGILLAVFVAMVMLGWGCEGLWESVNRWMTGCSGRLTPHQQSRPQLRGKFPINSCRSKTLKKKSIQLLLFKCFLQVACTNWKRTLIALNHDEPYPDPMSFKSNLVHRFDRFKLLTQFPMPERKHYTKFLFVRDPFVRLISAYRDKMQKYDQYFYDGYVRVILQRFTNQRNLTVNYNVARKKGLRPSFYNFIQYIVDPRTQTYAFEPHWSQMYRLCHPCLIEYDFVGHQESLQEDAQELLKMVKLENDIKFPPSSENMTSPDSVMDWFQSVPLQDRRKLYKIYEEDFQLFGYRRPTELLDD